MDKEPEKKLTATCFRCRQEKPCLPGTNLVTVAHVLCGTFPTMPCWDSPLRWTDIGAAAHYPNDDHAYTVQSDKDRERQFNRLMQEIESW